MERQTNLTFEESLIPWDSDSIYRDRLLVTQLRPGLQPVPEQDVPVRIDAITINVVLQGEIRLNIDFVPYSLGPNMILEAFEHHLVSDLTISADFVGYFILADKDFAIGAINTDKVMPPDAMMSKRLNPVMELTEDEMTMVVEIIERLQTNMSRSDHFFHDGIVKTAFGTLMMELWDMNMRRGNLNKGVIEQGSKLDLTIKFFHMVRERHREHHDVAYYAERLCVTPDYLTRVMKSITGQSALQFIQKVLVTEAKIMLREKNRNVQQVADELNFFDQSAFGKFFKKHAGVTPAQYKNRYK